MDTGATRVVLVEDDPHWRDLVAILLRKTGRYEVCAPDLEVWADEVRTSCPDVLLLDLNLAGTDAVEHIPCIVSGCQHTMVAALTSRSADRDEPAVREAGAFAFYEKASVSDLPNHLEHDLRLFQRALRGEPVTAPSAVVRRPMV